MNILGYLVRLFTLDFYVQVAKGAQRFNPFLSIFILCLVTLLKPTITLYTQGYVFAQGFESQVATLIDRIYPDDLEVRIQNGVVTTNVQEPYYVTVSPDTFKGTFLESNDRSSSYKQRLLAIDTHGRAEDFERYQSAALLTDRSLVYYNDNKIRIQPLREADSMILNKKIVQAGFTKITTEMQLGKWLRIAVIILPFILLIGLYFAKWVALLWYSLIVWGMMKIFFPGVSYGRSLTYTAAVSFIPGILFIVIPLIPSLPLYSTIFISLFYIFVLAFAYIGIYYAKHTHDEEVES